MNRQNENGDERNWPGWVKSLMRETFFISCNDHLNLKKNEKNVLCLICCVSVRRYVYHEVVRLDDLEKLVDCSSIQPYTINGAKVIFLNQRAHGRPCKGANNVCFNCERILQEPFIFCSFSCKMNYMGKRGEDITAIVYRINVSEWQLEGNRIDCSELTEDDGGTSTVNANDEVTQKKSVRGRHRRKGIPRRSPFS